MTGKPSEHGPLRPWDAGAARAYPAGTTLRFDAANEAVLQTLLGRYPTKRACLIPALKLAQKQWGYLSLEALDYVGGRLELPRSDVLACATFYTMLHLRPVGRHHVQICHNVACFLRGADALKEHVAQRLGIDEGGVTPDGEFSLEGVECLASCGTAPAMMINETYHENLTTGAVDAILDDCRRRSAERRAGGDG